MLLPGCAVGCAAVGAAAVAEAADATRMAPSASCCGAAGAGVANPAEEPVNEAGNAVELALVEMDTRSAGESTGEDFVAPAAGSMEPNDTTTLFPSALTL